MNKEKKITKITIEYDDGNKEEITKGFIASVSDEDKDGNVDIGFNMYDISGEEVYLIIRSMIELGRELDMF